MKPSAFIKNKKNGVASCKICRWCVSTCDALEPLANDESGQCNLEKLFDCTGFQANVLPGVPSFLCTKCESHLDKMYTFRWRCNKNIARVNGFTEKQNTAKNEADSSKDHLGHSAEQMVGTELLIKTEITAPDSAKDLHLNQMSCTADQTSRSYECCWNQPFVAEETAIAIKLENVVVDEQYRLQTNAILDNEQGILKTYPLELVYQDQEDISMTNNMCADGTKLSIKTEDTTPDEAKDLSLNQRSCTAHQANRTYECCGNQPDDLFEAEENPIAFKLENEDVDEQDNSQTNHLELICQDGKDAPVINITYGSDSPSESKQKSIVVKAHKVDQISTNRNNQRHPCPHCSDTYIHPCQLKIHIRTHTSKKPVVCNICSKAFSSRCSLVQHKKIHNKDEYEQCPHCPSKFAQSSTLKNHIRIHAGVKPFVCKICKKAFYSSSTLSNHSKIHNKDEYKQCPHCPSKFPLSSALKDHIRIHTGEKPFECEICGQTFRYLSNLAQHKKIHNKDEYKQCPHCPSKFPRLTTFKDHIRIHTGEKPFVCTICKKAFHSLSGLSRHSKIHKKNQ